MSMFYMSYVDFLAGIIQNNQYYGLDNSILMQINATCNGRKSTSKKLWKKTNEGSEYNKSRSNLWGNEDLEYFYSGI